MNFPPSTRAALARHTDTPLAELEQLLSDKERGGRGIWLRMCNALEAVGILYVGQVLKLSPNKFLEVPGVEKRALHLEHSIRGNSRFFFV